MPLPTVRIAVAAILAARRHGTATAPVTDGTAGR
jgi:hypothetical protein